MRLIVNPRANQSEARKIGAESSNGIEYRVKLWDAKERKWNFTKIFLPYERNETQFPIQFAELDDISIPKVFRKLSGTGTGTI